MKNAEILPVLLLSALTITGCAKQEISITPKDVQLEYGMVLLPERMVEENVERNRITLTDAGGQKLPVVPEPGKQEVQIFVDQKPVGTAVLNVEDTIAPHLVKKTEVIEISEDALTMDSDLIRESLAAEDLSGITFSLDDSEVAYGVSGEYPASAVFTDRVNNETIWSFHVRIGKSSENTSHSEKPESGAPLEENPAEGYGTVVNGILIVNKKHPISAEYSPGNDPTAVEAVNRLIADMKNAGLDVSYETSGFRDYDYQSSLYNGYVSRDGAAAADTYSARPGYSEHQTGLTFDMKHSDGSLITRENEASWLRDHAADYGFIIRYPYGKESITGYSPEPWHLRYVGTEHARKIRDAGLTLEEYLGVEGGDYVS